MQYKLKWILEEDKNLSIWYLDVFLISWLLMALPRKDPAHQQASY